MAKHLEPLFLAGLLSKPSLKLLRCNFPSACSIEPQGSLPIERHVNSIAGHQANRRPIQFYANRRVLVFAAIGWQAFVSQLQIKSSKISPRPTYQHYGWQSISRFALVG
jgi:hypothetical protein